MIHDLTDNNHKDCSKKPVTNYSIIIISTNKMKTTAQVCIWDITVVSCCGFNKLSVANGDRVEGWWLVWHCDIDIWLLSAHDVVYWTRFCCGFVELGCYEWMTEWTKGRDLDQETDCLTFKLLKSTWQPLSNSLTNHQSFYSNLNPDTSFALYKVVCIRIRESF